MRPRSAGEVAPLSWTPDLLTCFIVSVGVAVRAVRHGQIISLRPVPNAADYGIEGLLLCGFGHIFYARAEWMVALPAHSSQHSLSDSCGTLFLERGLRSRADISNYVVRLGAENAARGSRPATLRRSAAGRPGFSISSASSVEKELSPVEVASAALGRVGAWEKKISAMYV